ncbi:MAG: proteobacterial dedicated sortase system histidine kinase [Pseudomonadota bacterium]|nr:proteobacterial dedicated sortase system histidine kinase [Pseudomonadota bacterium]MEC9040964.1 proteobacterial dedicated sortase system histidine kinase [Pseudomonadota bacterium]
MSLKRQLLLASLLMLLVPWAGLRFVLELDSALRQQALQQLQAQGARLADVAGDRLLDTPVATDQGAIYAGSTDQTITIDGYGHEWPGFDEGDQPAPWQTAGTTSPLRWQASHDDQFLYLLIQRLDQGLALYNPARPDQAHERLELWLQAPARELGTHNQGQRWFIRAVAPGDVPVYRAEPAQARDHRLQASWQDKGASWELELKLPLPSPGSRLGFQATREGQPNNNTGTTLAPPPLLVQQDNRLEHLLKSQISPGQQATVLEPGSWILAHSRVAAPAPASVFDDLSPGQILEQISLNALSGLIRLYQPEPMHLPKENNRLEMTRLPDNGLVRHDDGSVWLATRHELFGGRILLLEQSLDQLLTLSGSTLGSVLARSLLIILALMLVLLGYASWLSWRITRLQALVEASVDDDGRILAAIPSPRSRDELGQLQQHFSQMVARLQNYNQYLESFSRRLSHELKTPVAVVRSSLENLAQGVAENERQQYLERAATATERLRRILHSMSEAARLEQSFEDTEKEPFDLARVLAEATSAYQQLDTRHRIVYSGPASDCVMNGSPEMLVQMLDKLVDNARDFTPEGGGIDVCLHIHDGHYLIEVFNEGSRLPDHDGVDIFGAFVSQRSGAHDGHLGQGLLIVRLIADYHGGRVEARNQHQSGIDGVCFRVIIPATEAKTRTLP